MNTFKRLESEVRGYCRSFPTVFTKAKGAILYDEAGKTYIDFLSGAGTLNYGHNNDLLKEPVIQYLAEDGVLHGLDMMTRAKEEFLQTFETHILKPRGLSYKMQFTGPTGTNAVEAAMKLARKVTGRTNIVSFTNGFHGVTAGSVAATGNSFYREATGMPLANTSFLPYDGYMGEEVDTLAYIRKVLEDGSSGVDKPAAFILETVQGEGGVNVASTEWLKGIEEICNEFGILLIVDDIQVGCGRTGTFFSFEEAGIEPDIILLSKSLSGYGLPFALVLMQPDLDKWKPGEHNGTFRGNNLAFVSATETIKTYWEDDLFSKEIGKKADILEDRVRAIADRHGEEAVTCRGRGMIWGLECKDPARASKVTQAAFRRGLVIETSGAEGQVVKCLPALTIAQPLLNEGLQILEDCFLEVFEGRAPEREKGNGKKVDIVALQEKENILWGNGK
jgi:diaminobutyrate-2-oxoglutarate transaminase